MKRIACAIASVTIAGLGIAPGLAHANGDGSDCYPPAPPEEPPVAAPDYGKITVSIEGLSALISGHWLLPGSTYFVTVHSTPQSLGTGLVGSDGSFSSTFTIPSGLEPGEHTLTVTATVHDGSPTATSKTFTVAAAAVITPETPDETLDEGGSVAAAVGSEAPTGFIDPTATPVVAALPTAAPAAAAADPIVASFGAPPAAVPASGTAASKLPTTGGSPMSGLRLGSFAILTGLGMMVVSSVRRRRRAVA